MVGDVHFTLKPPDAGCGQVDGATGMVAEAQEAVLSGAGAAGVVPTPPWFPYETYPVTYT